MMIPEDSSGSREPEAWSSDTARLLKTVDEESLDILEALLLKGTPINAHGGAFHETALHKSAQQGWAEGLQFLLAKGATSQSINQFGQTPLHYAAASKSCECVRSLLESGCHATLDHKDMRGHTPLHDAAAVGHPEGVSLLLKAGAKVDIEDKSEETPLYKAAKAKCVKSILLLLNYGADLGVKDKTGESVLSYILRHFPAGLDSLLDQCLIPNANKLSSKKLEVSFNFVPLAGSSEMSQMKVLSDAVDLGHPKMLLHPVCEAFLLVKWHNVRKLFFIEVIFYFVHAILATSLVLDKFVWQGVGNTFPEKIPTKTFNVLEAILLFQIIVILLKQILTLIQGVRTWLFSLWHVLNGVIPVLVLMVIPGQRATWQHHFATIVVLLIWVQCMLHIGRFPGCGIYVAMFTRVAKVFLKIFLIFFCLLLAFSLSFYISKFGAQMETPGNSSTILINQTMVDDEVYSNPGMTFIKTLTMMIGELDFDSEFVLQLRDLPGTSHIIYLSFVILVSIILSNLLVALAVNDVQGLRNSAHLERLIKQMELVFQMERTFTSLLAFAALFNFTWFQEQIKIFVHDLKNSKVFVQPFHPHKGTKLILIEQSLAREINLRHNHVTNVIERLRMREEESKSILRKRSVRKSRQVRSQYSGFSNVDDDLRDVLKNVETNILDSFSEKMEEVSNTIFALSQRIKTLEDTVFKTEGCSATRIVESNNISPNQSSLHFQSRAIHSSIRNTPQRPPRSLRNMPRYSGNIFSQQESGNTQDQQPPLLLQEENEEPCLRRNPEVHFEMGTQRSTSMPAGDVTVNASEIN